MSLHPYGPKTWMQSCNGYKLHPAAGTCAASAARVVEPPRLTVDEWASARRALPVPACKPSPKTPYNFNALARLLGLSVYTAGM